MLTDTHRVDAWVRTIGLLSIPEASAAADEKPIPLATRRNRTEADVADWSPFVRVIDRPSAHSLTLDWRDPTRCCYREQLWVAAHSRVSGRCAMSGKSIAPGDEIYRPRPTRPAPRNVAAMILASAVEACYPRSVQPGEGQEEPRTDACVRP
ncbi:hypothetical protein LMG27952_02884 [Paraburkholderia hiiakae]|uniref:DUF3331 domain-containing protein n=1 Tax=Paraburkholderia hiiakae TaxID=1081782 RepID=A0ABM8NN02_9BURK|nr:DUF3331 domain-containing protein [Paraburkholderia hiiakae]CAD6534115.1 hypothetical protein LMG27952_02884 [Paraburkholderia hiiakae]